MALNSYISFASPSFSLPDFSSFFSRFQEPARFVAPSSGNASWISSSSSYSRDSFEAPGRGQGLLGAKSGAGARNLPGGYGD